MNFKISNFEEYKEVYKKSVEQPEIFWAEVAENFQWRKKWDKVLSGNFNGSPNIKWFEGAKLNITENALDRHLADRANQKALIWEPNKPNEPNREFTYAELHKKVSQFANVLKKNGVKKGDRVCIYLPMVPELPISMLACARIGAVHSVIFAGFSSQSIVDRVQDAGCSLIITADGAYRGDKTIALKPIVDEALLQCPSVKKVIVLDRTAAPVAMLNGRDIWWDEEMLAIEKAGNNDCPAEEMDAEDMLFILYTSGSTGKPKGVVHTCAGYMVYTAYMLATVFQHDPSEVHFCSADIGWITGHSYVVYSPLIQGGTTVMFEGIPTYPDSGRFWDIVDKYKVNIFYTAPTAIRQLMTAGLEPLKNKDLSSLKKLGTAGEPINEEAWHWYNENIGKGKCPIMDTWWQTETAGPMISSIAFATPSKPGFATLPMPGIQLVLVDDKGDEIKGNGVNGNLCIKAPWPAIVRTTYGDHERYRTNYFSTYEGMYFTGDGCLRDEDGMYRITGRVDDVLNVSGHRIGTAELENAINMYSGVVESAIVGYPHDVKGQGIYAYVVIPNLTHDAEQTKKDIMATVSRIIGPISKPDKIQFVSALPKTRSGKIMRRILRKIAEGDTENLGDTSTLLDPSVVEEIKKNRL